MLRGASMLVVTALLAGCDCLRTVSATVLDQDTNSPLQQVEVRERHGDGTYEELSLTTDEAGLFEFRDISGGLGKCPDVQLHFTKEGFLPLDRTFPSFTASDTVFMKAQR
jgi:hypothetical protein